MNKLKRTLALTLVLCMLCSFFPVSAFAAGNGAPVISGTSDAPFKQGTGGSNSFRIPALVTLSDGTLVAAADARWNTTYDGGGHDTMVAISKDNGANWTHSFANYLGDNGNAYDGGSSCFIDPSLAVLTTYEGNDDMGKDTIFMLCDLYPTGVAINGSKQITPGYSTGFNADGNLKLTTATLSATNGDYDDTDFTHYLKDGEIYPAGSTTAVDGLSVDGYFNVTGTYNGETINSNLFFADSPFKVARTGYLYLTKSDDGGESWSEPTLLNLKTNQEMVCLVGPNGGMVTSEGVIVFPVYSYTSSGEYTGLIYSTDGGSTWRRSASLTSIDSSEADAVELDNGNLRVFFRNETTYLCYADYDLTNNTWVTQASGLKYVNTRVLCNSNTELSAITYSQSVNHNGVEKTVILVSCPASANLAGSSSSDGSWRTSGRIFAGLVDPETYEMTWLENSVAVTPVATGRLTTSNYTAEQGFFAYSSMTEHLENGSVTILYEDNQYGWGYGNDKYYTIASRTFTMSELEAGLGISFAGNTDIEIETPGETYEKDVALKLSETFTETVPNIYVTSGNTETNVATVTWVGTQTQDTVTETLTAATIPTSSGSVEAYISDGHGNYLTLNDDNTLGNATSAADATKWTITYQSTNNNGSLYQISSGNYKVALSNSTLIASTTSNSVNHYYTAERGFYCSYNGSNVWQYNGTKWTIGNSGNNNGKAYDVEIETTEGTKSTAVTITPKTVGTTTVQIGNGAICYNITVSPDDDNVVNVDLKVNQTSQTYTDETGNYEDNIAQRPDDSIVEMTVTGHTQVTKKAELVTAPARLVNGKRYILENVRASQPNQLPTRSVLTSRAQGTGLDTDGPMDVNTSESWLIIPNGDSFQLSTNNQYVKLGNVTASMVSDPTDLTFEYVPDNGWLIYLHNPYNGADYFLSDYSGSYWREVVGYNNRNDDGNYWNIYEVVEEIQSASTTVTFTGKTVGSTTAIIGETTYNITVSLPEGMSEVKVELEVDESQTFTDNSGNHAGNITRQPDDTIVDMDVTGKDAVEIEKDLVDITNTDGLVAGKQYLIVNYRNGKAMTTALGTGSMSWVSGSSLNGFSLSGDTDENSENLYLWSIVPGDNGGYYIMQGDRYLTFAQSGNNHTASLTESKTELTFAYGNYAADSGSVNSWRISKGNTYLSNVGSQNLAVGYNTADAGGNWIIYEFTGGTTPASTEITFTGVSQGKTSAIVGNTLYNITVIPRGVAIVNITVEVDESFTFTDLTGNHADEVSQRPDESKATMSVVGVQNTYQKSLVHVTSLTFDPNKQYVIENVQAKTNQPDCSVLTSETATYTLTGLVMNGPVDVNTSQTWTFTPDHDNQYAITSNGKYLTFANQNATMETTRSLVYLTYVEGRGWTLKNANNVYLCDLFGIDSGEAFGTTNTSDGGIYWNIYEVVDETTVESTEVTFTGVTAGTTTTAIVGNILYNITVIDVTDMDEVLQSAIDIEEGVRVDTFVVEPQYQRDRYYDIVEGKRKDLYTDESWKVYETARQAAYKKLTEVTNGEYPSADKAQDDLDALKALIDALKAAEAQLVSATIISVKYHVNEVTDTPLDIKEYKITSKFDAVGNLDLDGLTVTLPETIVVDGMIYQIDTQLNENVTEDFALELEGAETFYDVIVSVVGKAGGGFVGSGDIDKGYHNEYHQLTDLVDNDGVGRKITELTFTTGFNYDLNLATDTTGMTVTWSIENEAVATVDQEGNVVAVAPGTTYVTATVTENGEVVEVNTIPVTVFQSGTGTRITGLYAEQVDNTTVWCVVNADTESYSFEVIEGELIYGQFDKTITADNTNTTAMSFFGDPDEAHALVLMQTNQAAGDYYLLHDDDGNLYDGTKPGMDSNKYYVSGQTTGAGYWQAVGLTDNVQGVNTAGWQLVKDMVQWAIDQGCDGGLGFTRRQGEGNLCDNLYFVSDPMARIEKTVDGVLPVTRKMADYKRYVPNMVAAVKEQVYFKLTVTLECPSVWKENTNDTVGAIGYTDAIIADTVLPGAFLYSKDLDNLDGKWDGEVAPGNRKQTDTITDALNAPWTAEEKAAGKRVLEYYLVYEIQESDIPKFWIDNIANLSYDYQSEYSAGAQAGSADAEARISVTGSAIENVVIDFGQSFVYAGHDYTSITDGNTYTFEGLTDAQLKGAFVGENAKATASYGDVTVEKNGEFYTVTYTPNSILQSIDAVQIFGEGENGVEKVINGFLVYPASTVYYEEGFILTNNNGWNIASAETATRNQSFEMLGTSIYDDVTGAWIGRVSNKKHAYGFDPIYDGVGNDDVVKSSISSDIVGASTEFTFTGTGFELFADCTQSSGFVSVTVTDADGNLVKMLLVNTVVKGGSSGATTGQTGNMNSLPIVSLKDLKHGTYTVTLTKVMDDEKTVAIDGVRITNTHADSTVYTIDLEDSPEFYQLRDAALNAIGIRNGDSEDYDEDIGYGDLETMTKQVYNALLTGSDTEAPAAVITSRTTPYGDSSTIQDLLDNGPKNEIYLWQGQTLTFKVSTQRVMQVGLKAPSGATTYTVTCTGKDEKTGTMAANTDMFYYVVDAPVADVTEYTVSITNTGSKVLAITDLKVCDDPSAAMVPLTEDDVRQILIDAGYTDSVPETPEKPAVPFGDVAADSFYYDAVAWAVSEGITTGISESHFGPMVFCNRAQAVTFLWRAAGSPEPTTTEHPFADVPAGSFYEKAVLWALENGITTGTDGSHFSPMMSCNRATVVTFLYRAFQTPAVGNTENPFSDVPADSWFTAPILWAVEQGITTGMGDGTFDVNGACNRAQIVTFLYRAYN